MSSSIWDEPEFDNINPGGAEAEFIETLPVETWDAPGRIDWRAVNRWCMDHPGRMRKFEGIYSSITTVLRGRYPHLKVKATRHRRRPTGGKGQVCDIYVVFIQEGDMAPWEGDVPGAEVRVARPPQR